MRHLRPTDGKNSGPWPEGFTLTDLLVSLAVLSVLAALIVPLAVKASASSRLRDDHGGIRPAGHQLPRQRGPDDDRGGDTHAHVHTDSRAADSDSDADSDADSVR